MHLYHLVFSLTATVFLGQIASRAASDDDIERIEKKIYDDELERRENQMYNLRDFLGIAGRRMDVHFTIESASMPPLDVPHAKTLVNGKTRFSSLGELVATLSKKFHWLSFEIDGRRPRIVHVIDKRLRGKEGYALEKKADMEFAGTLDELCWALQKQVPGLHGNTSGSLTEAGTDYYTETVVRAKNRTARQILTDAVPLRCYGPLLWCAQMSGDGDNPAAAIDVAFGGPKESVELDRSRWWWWLESAHKHGTNGAKLRCFFTIETTYRRPDDSASCPIYINNEETFESPEALVAELTKRVGWLTAVKDARRPEIVHLVDEELLKLDGYALDRRVDIDYEGTPDGLVLSLEQEGRAGPRRNARTNEPFSRDHETHIMARAKGRPVREVLTDSISLDRTNAVLWHSRTYLRKGDSKTTIEYRHP